MEFFVDANRVGKLDWLHWAGVRPDRVGDLREEYLVPSEDLEWSADLIYEKERQ